MIYHIIHKMKLEMILKYLFFSLTVPAKSGEKVVCSEKEGELSDVKRRRGSLRPQEFANRIKKVRRIISKIRQIRNSTVEEKKTQICTKERKTDSSHWTMASTESSPNPWTSWWTGWSFQDLDVGLDMKPTSPTISNISPRLDQKPSGLFDNELAGISDDHAGNNKMDDSTDNFLKSEKYDLDDMEGDMSDFLNSFTGDDFLNSFVDLSNFATEDQDEDLAPAGADPNVAVPPVVDFHTAEAVIPDSRGEKRHFLDVVNVEPMAPCPTQKKRKLEKRVELDTVTAGLDHDYVSKKKSAVPTPVIVDPFDDQEWSSKPAPKATHAQKYRIRREKNNIASKRSREIRKVKYVNMEVEAEKLEMDNERMRAKIIELEKMAKEMKAALIGKLAGK